MRHLVIAIVLVCLTFPLISQADRSLTKDLVHIAFTVAERQVVERYFSEDHEHYAKKHGKKNAKPDKNRKGLPPGLAKRHELPPGLAKRQQLPPGLAKKALPADLVSQLPPVREGLERAIIAGSIVLIDIATGVVLDIIEDIYLGD